MSRNRHLRNDEMMEYKQVKARRTMGYKKQKVAKNNGCDDNKADGGCYVRRRYNIQTSSGQDLVLPFSEVRMLTFLCKLFLNYYLICLHVFSLNITFPIPLHPLEVESRFTGLLSIKSSRL